MRVIVPPREEYVAPTTIHDVWQKVQAAMWAGVFVSLGLAVLVSAICLPGGFWEVWLWAMAGSVVAGVIVTCWLGWWWVIAAASRPWKIDDKTRERAWKLEDDARNAEEEAAKAAKEDVNQKGGLDGNPATLDQAQLLHLVAIEVLRRHYVLGKKVTRDAMEAEGVKQADWNFVNQAMVSVGLKVRKTMRPDLDFQTAWEIWKSSVDIREDGYLWTLNMRGNWKALIKVF